MKKIKIILFTTLIIAGLVSCEKKAKDEEYGDPLIYIPQAYTTDGTNDYSITVSNYDESDTSVVLGICRGSTGSLESVSVNLSFDTDTVTKAIAYANTGTTSSEFQKYLSCTALDISYCSTLPSTITIPAGSNYTYIKLGLKDSNIMNDTHSSDYFAIGVRISNPTKYTINDDLSFVMLVISRNFTR
jgi:hypothetical protein